MMQSKNILLIFLVLFMNCKEKKTGLTEKKDILQITKDSIRSITERNKEFYNIKSGKDETKILTEEEIFELEKRVKRLQVIETDRSEYLNARNEARKKFEHLLTDQEKEVIGSIRDEYNKGVKLIEEYTEASLTNRKEASKELELKSQLAYLQLNKRKNYIIDNNDMLPIIVGDKKEDIFKLSNKYYAEIMRVESKYSDRIKKFYTKNATRIKNDSTRLMKSNVNLKNPRALILGRMDHTMDFLIVSPD